MIDRTEHGSEPQNPGRRCPGETRVAFRERVQERQKYRYYVIGLALQGLSYDLAVLQANYIVDRRLRGDAAVGAFQYEVPAIMERVEKSWRGISRRLGLSCRKQERDGVQIAKLFLQVGADLRQATTLDSQDAADGDNAIDTITTQRRGGTTVKSGKQQEAGADPNNPPGTNQPKFVRQPKPLNAREQREKVWPYPKQLYHDHDGGGYRVVHSPEEHTKAISEGWADIPSAGIQYVPWTAEEPMSNSENSDRALPSPTHPAGKDIDREYPRYKYHWTKAEQLVHNAEEEAALGGGWADTPNAFNTYKGSRSGPTEKQDPVKWVDPWLVPALSSIQRNKIKAQLWKADAAFWRELDAPSADANSMRRAFDGIAKVLFDAGILTEKLLRNEIPELVWDSAIAGGWYRFASEVPKDIFPEHLGHYWVWRDEDKDWQGLFRGETADWWSKLLDASEGASKPESGVVESDSQFASQIPLTETPEPPLGKSSGGSAAEKANMGLLVGSDGKVKRAVTLDVARRFGGVSRRAIEKAARKGSIESEGDGPNRRIMVQSLLKYFPPEK